MGVVTEVGAVLVEEAVPAEGVLVAEAEAEEALEERPVAGVVDVGEGDLVVVVVGVEVEVVLVVVVA